MPRATNRFPTIPSIPPDGQRPDNAVPFEALVEELLTHPGFAECIAHVERLPAREACFGTWPEALDDRLRRALAARGIDRPYSHQGAAIAHALAGRHVVVTTPTASGKSLCYNVPVLQSILADANTRALYLFPTKALSHDQYGELYELTKASGGDIKVHTYDGDTPPATRRALRDAGQIIVTNPDMLHNGILPHHTTWIRLFENLRYVVVDELHQYRGIFGSHLANVFARLRRLAQFYGAEPTFLACSATIANPAELAEKLTGLPFENVAENGAPCGPRTFVFFNPPVVNRELNLRRSVRLEARRIGLRFLAREYQTIVFARSRLDVEVMTTYLKRGMRRLHRDPDRIAGYRGGYLPTERRAIEKGLKEKQVLGVVSTNALELGVDIGSLDVALLAGYPGSIASLRQQAGRAGRKGSPSLAVYIGGSTPLDQFLMKNPEFLLGRSPEEALVNPGNLAVLADHLKCAAFELPFEDGESFGTLDPAMVLQALEDGGLLRHTGNRWYYASEAYPAEDVPLRSSAGENFIVLDTAASNKVIAEVDYDSAPFLLHDDAVYIHNAKTYLVEKLDWDRRTAFVRPKVVDYYTDAESSSTLQLLAIEEETPFESPESLISCISIGDANVTTIVAKFKKVKFETQESIGFGPVNVPPLTIQTEACWITLRDSARELLKKEGLDFGEGLRGVAQVLRHVVPLFVLCDGRDFAVQAAVRSPFEQRPAVTVWDRYPGGIGIARRLHVMHPKVMNAALEVVRNCGCVAGCPACVGAPLDGEATARRAALRLLEGLARGAQGER